LRPTLHEKNLVAHSLNDSREETPSHRGIREDIVIDGKRLETLRYEPVRGAAKSTIVMLHEGLGSISMWREFPEKLATATGCGLVLYSRYGHGKSQRLAEKRTPDFMHHEARVVLPRILEHFGIKHPILLGHSDGGSIALIYAGYWPERTRALILEAPHVFVEELSLRSIRAIRKMYDATDLREKFAKHHNHVDEMFWGWNDIWLDPHFLSWNIETEISKISCPVLMIQGDQDEYGTLAQVEAITKRLAHAKTLILPGCRHSPHRDAREQTLEAISKFVRALQ
jgi:pimeloyl-ACP methyl ester carboxylesterase